MPDELINCLDAQSGSGIAREEIICFQKLFYAYMSVFRERKCFNYFHFIVMRCRGGYRTIGNFINIKKASLMLDSLVERKGRLTLFFLIKVLLLSLSCKSWLLLPFGILALFKKGYLQESGKFLAITIATICDPYKYDSSIAVNRGQGIVIKDRVHESYGTYLMREMERKKRAT